MKDITVVVMTYNQVNYIDQAINSILSQKVNMDFDILIHDDFSDDGTYEKLLKYSSEHPNKIRIIRQKSRKFAIDGFNMMIYKYVVPHIDSKYVAYCDGDDYWCDDSKLQKQYDFMEQNTDYSMCFHSAYQLRPNNDMSSKWFIKNEGDIKLSDLINDKPGIPVATSSLFVKSNIFKDFPEWRKRYSVEDLPLYIWASMNGKIHRFKEVMCVYRQFSIGSWSSQNKNNVDKLVAHQNNMIKDINFFDIETKFKYHDLVEKYVGGCEFRVALLMKDFKTVFSKDNKQFLMQLPKKEKMSLKLQYRLPYLYNLLHNKRRGNHK